MKFSVVIPCFNEERVIKENLLSVVNYIENNCSDVDLELMPVNDGSSDSTPEILESLKSEYPQITPYHLPYNQGRGAAIKKGIKQSTGDFVMVLDADLSYDVDHIGQCLEVIKNSPIVDAIVLSPYMKGGKAENIPLSRLALSRCANWILSGFFDSRLSTVTSLARVYRGEMIRNLPLFEDGKELHLEILKKLFASKANIVEIPARLIWKSVKDRAGRLNKKKVANAAGNHVIYGFLSKPTRFLGKLALLTSLISLYEFYNVFRSFLVFYKDTEADFWRDVWLGLDASFSSSPHTVIIAITTFLFSVQLFSYLALFSVLRFHHEENLRHFLEILKRQN